MKCSLIGSSLVPTHRPGLLVLSGPGSTARSGSTWGHQGALESVFEAKARAHDHALDTEDVVLFCRVRMLLFQLNHSEPNQVGSV